MKCLFLLLTVALAFSRAEDNFKALNFSMVAFSPGMETLKTVNFTKNALEDGVGLYYEPMHQIRFTKAEWKLITFIDMEKLESQKPNITAQLFRKMTYHCLLKLKPEECSLLIHRDYVLSRYNLANKYISQLRAFMDIDPLQSDDDDIFVKRSIPFGFIGGISKALFGTLDEDDAKYYNDEIDKLYADQKKMVHLVDKQAHLIHNELHNFHDELDVIKNKSAENEYLTDLAFKALKKVENSENEMRFASRLKSWIHQVELEVETYVNNLRIFIDAIYFAKLGIIHPTLLTPMKLEETVNHFIRNNDNKECVFPLSLDEVRAGELGKISRTSIGYHEGKIILVMSVPLIDPRAYHLYKLHSYPTNQTFGGNRTGSAYIKPRAEFLVVSQEQDRYTLINNPDIPHCQASRDFHICIPSYPFYETSMQPICEISLITKRKHQPLQDCDIRVSKIFNPHWKQLHNMKGWLYSLPEAEDVHIMCGANSKETLTISGAGILHIKAGCYAHTVYATFMGHQVINQVTTFDFMPVTHLNVSDIFPEIVNYEPLRIVPDKKDIPRVTSLANIPGALSYDATLEEIGKQMKEIGEHKREKQKMEKIVFWTVVGEISLAIVTFLYFFRGPLILAYWKLVDCCRPAKKEEENIEMTTFRDQKDARIYDVPSTSIVF